MIARAPGKVVLSGAYAVLYGAPALVSAVDRYVVADAYRAAPRIVPEVAEALARRAPSGGAAPWFDARALFDQKHDRKLGLGSSAAILVASLAALELSADPALDDAALAARLFVPALVAHRAAQRGGSGIDVAASTFGGTLLFQRPSSGAPHPSDHASGAAEPVPRVEPFALPAPLFIQVWSSPTSAPTAVMLDKVTALQKARPVAHRSVMDRLAVAAEAASGAVSGAAFVEACRAQLEGLGELGNLAGAPIVTPLVHELDAVLSGEGAVALPSGAGGGDVVLVVSASPLGARATHLAEQLGLSLLSLSLGARGVHRVNFAARAVEEEVLS